MDSRVNGSGVDDRGNLLLPGVAASAVYNASYIPNGHSGGGSSNGSVLGTVNASPSGYTLMVAGQRTGKTSFLRLLLDTSEISQTATKEQLASVAKFVQGCSGHTSHIRTASIDIELDAVEGNGPLKSLALTVIDTPSLDFDDESGSERLVSDVLRYVEQRLAEGVEDEWKARTGDHNIHLCIYFLDPEDIVPPSVPAPPAPLLSRTRNNSLSQSDQEPVILEPPVTSNPHMYRPTLRQAQIDTIRRLSARVNVLPVLARADTLTNERLAAIRLAVRSDLAKAGIGFGIFDTESPSHAADSPTTLSNGDLANGYGSHPNGSSPNGTSPSSPVNQLFLRLPYALISPDNYSHSDGVQRIPPPRHELIHQYTPSTHPAPSIKMLKGKFIRSYRWGSLDVLDSYHSDFMALRTAVFHHMGTLQKYTREYLFDRFRAEYHAQHHSSSHHSLHHIQQGIVSRSQLPPLPITARPTLAIDTASPHATDARHSALHMPRDMALDRQIHSAPPVHGGYPEPGSSNTSTRVSPTAPRSSKQRTKKITVACNFCRSRKLKCDGGRPACGQCVKRSNSCDYQPQNNKRRAAQRHRRQGDESDSDLVSGEDPSADPSLSPDVSSHSVSRRSSNGHRHPPTPSASDKRDDHMTVPQMGHPHALSLPGSTERLLFKDNELPHIAALSLPGSDSLQHADNMQSVPLPPIRPASEHQAAQRKRASTVPNRSRTSSNTGPKVVACNFCRARKTRCDGQKPNCSSCERRTLPCNYNHDAPTTNLPLSRKRARRPSASQARLTTSPPPLSPPDGSHAYVTQVSGSTPDEHTHRSVANIVDESEVDLKRTIEDSEPRHKRMRREESPTSKVEMP